MKKNYESWRADGEKTGHSDLVSLTRKINPKVDKKTVKQFYRDLTYTLFSHDTGVDKNKLHDPVVDAFNQKYPNVSVRRRIWDDISDEPSGCVLAKEYESSNLKLTEDEILRMEEDEIQELMSDDYDENGRPYNINESEEEKRHGEWLDEQFEYSARYAPFSFHIIDKDYAVKALAKEKGFKGAHWGFFPPSSRLMLKFFTDVLRKAGDVTKIWSDEGYNRELSGDKLTDDEYLRKHFIEGIGANKIEGQNHNASITAVRYSGSVPLLIGIKRPHEGDSLMEDLLKRSEISITPLKNYESPYRMTNEERVTSALLTDGPMFKILAMEALKSFKDKVKVDGI